jgi:putative FmdB family regulatory protein
MPLYEYQCEACNHRFELIQKFSDPPPDACPVCGSRVRKLLSSPAIQFKGSGWYITDYARKPASSDGTDRESKGEKKTESPAPASDTSTASSSTPSPPASSTSGGGGSSSSGKDS